MPAAISVVIPAYNAADLIEATLLALQAQHLAAEVIVVDDASTDATAACVGRLRDVRLLRLDRNLGRAAARNAGAAVASAGHLMFLDCDCVPVGPDFLSSHLLAVGSEADGSCGPIETLGEGFWPRYQKRPAQTAGAQLALHTFTAANFSIRRDRFESIGGFNVAYRRYGFEDRDLYARLVAAGGHLVSAPLARVQHVDGLNLQKVWGKMQECGEDSAARFRADHPEQYRRMDYWHLDASQHSLLRWPGRGLAHLLRPTLKHTEQLLQVERIPFFLRRGVAKIYAASAYLYGTTRQSRS